MEDTVVDVRVQRLHKLDGEKSIKAFCDIVINECLLIKGLKIIDGPKGLFVSMPQEKAKDNKWYESVKCLNPDVRQVISQKVMEAFEESIAN